MTISRRHALQLGASAALLASSRMAAAQSAAPAAFAPKPGAWRTFEITTTVDVQAPAGSTQVWLPVPSYSGEGWMKPGETTWQTASGKATLVRDNKSGASMVHAIWEAGEARPQIEMRSRITARDRSVDLSAPRADAVGLSDADRRRFTAATELLPLNGIVAETAAKVTAGASGDLDKAKRIYTWIVDNTFRDPKTRGCGVGDIASMLKMGNLGGKCADLNALFVGLARASGLPARDIYGIRVAPSAFGYKSLGANSPTITKAQHCRAEVFISGLGWVPADPADVRKVVLEEPPGNLDVNDTKVQAARAALFGAWETNWLAFNDAHDVVLPGAKGGSVPFLMYPQAETGKGPLDPLDPDAFKYTIAAREVPA